MSYDDTINKDARLYTLKELAAQTDGRLNSALLQRILGMRYGVNRSIEWVETQLLKLQELGAVELLAGEVTIAQISRAGRDHLAMRSVIAGITRPAELP